MAIILRLEEHQFASSLSLSLSRLNKHFHTKLNSIKAWISNNAPNISMEINIFCVCGFFDRKNKK